MAKTKFAFPNIRVEQTKKQLTNEEVAKEIGLCRVSYESKLKSGRFVATEVLKLCELFQCEARYLFATEN